MDVQEHEIAVVAATGLLELHEPATLTDAYAIVFGAPFGTPHAELALCTAWWSYRHDRYRSSN
jgi:hypothetical protein